MSLPFLEYRARLRREAAQLRVLRAWSARDVHLRRGPEQRAAELAARTLALPDAQSVEDLAALLTSAGER